MNSNETLKDRMNEVIKNSSVLKDASKLDQQTSITLALKEKDSLLKLMKVIIQTLTVLIIRDWRFLLY